MKDDNYRNLKELVVIEESHLAGQINKGHSKPVCFIKNLLEAFAAVRSQDRRDAKFFCKLNTVRERKEAVTNQNRTCKIVVCCKPSALFVRQFSQFSIFVRSNINAHDPVLLACS